MGKQEKRDKAAKAGAAKAEAIIQETVTKVRAASEDDIALGQKVKELRDAGTAWWAIGQALGLEGAGDSAATGKKGAGRARALYRKAFGEVPRSQAVRGTGKASREKNETVKALKKTNKEERKANVRKGIHVLDESMTDEEIVAAVQGRVIGWTINLGDIDGEGTEYVEQEEAVHPTSHVAIEWHGMPEPERCIVFKVQDRRAPLNVRGIPGQTRIVRVSRIHTVR